MEVLNKLAIEVWNLLQLPFISFGLGVVFTKLIEHIFDRHKDKRELKLKPRFGIRNDAFGNPSFELGVKNTGAKDLGIHFYGYRNWYGGGFDTQNNSMYVTGQILKPEEAEIFLPFYDGNKGRYLSAPDDAYFYFVETGNKVFRHYTRPYIVAKFKRFWIFLHQVLDLKH